MTESERSNLKIPPEMHAFAEHSVAQARRTFDDLMTASVRAVSSIEGQDAAVRANAHDLQGKAMAFAERNVAASFDFARELVRARGAEEVVKLQAGFMAAQLQALTEQVREIASVTAAGAALGRPRP